ncbi:SPOR domain-containing protein [bacterium]|nr:SPOR domain-containing protein [Bacteroides sp.]MBD5338044.1 SPOR domain-containing protein [Bacteroides sp.]MBD5384999.1 SPOR domain-containing protein [bacterium]
MTTRRQHTLLSTLILMISLLLPAITARAQDASPEAGESETRVNVIQKIVESSDGNVEILIDDDLTEKILTPPSSHKKASSASNASRALKPGLNKMAGYRIQVFSDGRNQASLESRARARGNAITAKFPKYRGQVYTFSSAPNWYTRVGNFRSASEASEALVELRRSFPSFADEMRVVKCQIVVMK